MKNILKAAVMGVALLAGTYGAGVAGVCAAAAQEAGSPSATHQVIVRNGTNPTTKLSNEIFTGNANHSRIWRSLGDTTVSGSFVTFEPGARASWHTHPKGQLLVVTFGKGLVQEWGQPIQEINAGDVIWCPPGVKHWHGGGYNTSMTHVSVCEAVDGKNVTWLEKVSDDEYYGRK